MFIPRLTFRSAMLARRFVDRKGHKLVRFVRESKPEFSSHDL